MKGKRKERVRKKEKKAKLVSPSSPLSLSLPNTHYTNAQTRLPHYPTTELLPSQSFFYANPLL